MTSAISVGQNDLNKRDYINFCWSCIKRNECKKVKKEGEEFEIKVSPVIADWIREKFCKDFVGK